MKAYKCDVCDTYEDEKTETCAIGRGYGSFDCNSTFQSTVGRLNGSVADGDVELDLCYDCFHTILDFINTLRKDLQKKEY